MNQALRVDDFVRRRLDGSHEIDEYGFDPDVLRVLDPLFALRWSIEVRNAATLPQEGPVLLVFNRRFGVSEPFVVARSVRQATGRTVRVAGAPDLAPLGPACRRLGSVLERPDEIAGLLRRDAVVGVALRPSRPGHAGRLRRDLLGAALDAGALVVPVAVWGREIGRRWGVELGAPLERPTTRDPLATEDLADRARQGVQAMLDRTPNRWPNAGRTGPAEGEL